MWTTLAALVVAFLPGAVWLATPWAEPKRRQSLSCDEQVFWGVLLSVAWSCGATLALAALRAYSFPRLLMVNVGAVVFVAAAARFELRWRASAPLSLHALLPVAVVLAGLWMYLPPSEYVMGGKDPGTYMNQGVQIAQRGSLVIEDPVVASVPPPFRDLFFPSHQNPTYYGLRFMGFFIQDPGSGAVVGQFPHLFPASIAIGYGLNGLSGARQAVVAWTLLGLVAWYYLGARLLGRTPAAVATALLAINVITVWFARYPNAEVVMLALLGAALLATARATIDGDPFFAPLGGVLLGLLLFLRVDAVLAVAAVVAGLVLARGDGHRAGWGFWAALLPLLGMSAWYLTGPMRAYLAYPVVYVSHLPPWGVAALGLVSLATVSVLPWLISRPSIAPIARRWIPVTYAVVIVALAGVAALRQPAFRVAPHDAAALRTFAWYITEPGLLLAVLGLAVAATTRFWRDPMLFVTIGVYAGFFFYKIRIVPQHFWMTRRYLPVILPASLLMVSALAAWLAGRLPRTAPADARATAGLAGRPGPPRRDRVVRDAAIVCALLPLALTFWSESQPVLRHVEYAGLIPQLEALAGRFGDEDLVIVESRNASDLHVLALPLAYIYARNILVLASPKPDRAAFAMFLDWARSRYRAIYFLGGGGTDLVSRRYSLETAGGDRFQVPEYASPVNAYPSGVRHKEFDFSLTRFLPPHPGTGTFSLDVGTNDDLMVVRFHAKELDSSNGMTYRWSRNASYISIPGIVDATRTVTIWMGAGGRPEGLPPPQVTVTLDGVTLGSVTATRDVRPYSFAIPPSVAAEAGRRDEPASLRLTTSTWLPRQVVGTPDDRDLGVLVDRIEAR
jgi:hypothetical protein